MLTSTGLRDRVQIFRALRYRDYRLFWVGQLCGVIGFQMLLVAQGWLVYDLTSSKLQLGLVGLSSALPSILLNLFGGVVADKVDQRRLIIGVQFLGALVLLALATLTATHLVETWHVMASAFLMGGLGAFDQPSRQAIFPRLIDREVMMNAVALNSLLWQGSRIVGPALAGVLIATLGVAVTFYVAAAAFLIFVLFLVAVRVPRIIRPPSSNMFRDMAAGLGFVWDNHIFLFLLGMVFFNSFFGMSYIQLMPVFQKDILLVNETGLGLLLAFGGVGAVVGGLFIASMGDSQRRGLILIASSVVFGCSLVLFAFSRWFPVSLGLVALAGMTNAIYMVCAQSTLHMLVPDHFRGRVMGFWGITYNLMPLGGFQAGTVANYADQLYGQTNFGAPFAVAMGGVAVVAFTLLGTARDSQIRRLGMDAVAG